MLIGIYFQIIWAFSLNGVHVYMYFVLKSQGYNVMIRKMRLSLYFSLFLQENNDFYVLHFTLRFDFC